MVMTSRCPGRSWMVMSGAALCANVLLVALVSDRLTLTTAESNGYVFGQRYRLRAKRDVDDDVRVDSRLYKTVSGSSSEGLPVGCHTCAIVGNAGTLLGSGLGWIPDESDCVFRLGLAPTEGHEKDVGAKTTVRVIRGDSLGDLLRRPERLTTGPLKATTWLLFNPANVDPLKIGLKLRQLRRDSNITVVTLTQTGESDAQKSYKIEAGRIGYTQLDSLPSTLWHAVQASVRAGCNDTKILGVPGPKFCKKNANTYHGKTASRYWGTSSPPLCSQGKDGGAGASPAHDLVTTLTDRRALKGWASETSSKVTFLAPTWSLIES